MTHVNQVEPAASASARVYPLLLCLFIGSGCAALIYEIVWFQLLELVIGSSAVSLGVLLGTFMGGMCLGSLALPRLVAARRHPLLVYALIELGIGVIAIAVLFGMPYVGGLYVANAAHGYAGILLRGAICAALLLPPTLLMGATLPAIARFTAMTPLGVSWLGVFYTGNIAGAAFGCLFAGFYLLRIHDMAIATYVAAAINGLVAVIAIALAKAYPHRATADADRELFTSPAPKAWSVYLTIALSGCTALGAQVVWTRLLSLLLGASVYTFSIILAVFLIGLGIGSSVGSFMARSLRRPRLALGASQILLAGAIAWSAFMIADSLPYWPIDLTLGKSPWITFQLDLVRCIWAILPAACLWGASFPLALAAAASHAEPGRVVGAVYAANTVGAILGALAFSMLLIPWLGTQHSQRLLIGLAAAAGLLMLLPYVPLSADGLERPKRQLANAIALALSLLVVGLLIRAVPAIPPGLVAYGRALPGQGSDAVFHYVGEGMNASVAVTETDGEFSFHVSGKTEASTGAADMRLQRMLGHFSALLHPKPRSVLIVGFGAGVTAGSFVTYPEIERIVICEIEPLIPRAVAGFFRKENYDVLNDPRVEVVYDDARHYILTTREKFDIITSDPIHPWVKGAATLYTKEYFELARRHLNPGGVITQWVPLYESTLDVVKSELATFFSVFPDGIIWANNVEDGGYDTVISARLDPAPIDVEALQKRLERPDYARVLESLVEVQFSSAADLFTTYAGRARDLMPWLQDAAINTDRDLRLQYLAGMGLNLYQERDIYGELVKHRRFPDDLFIASEATKQSIRDSIERPHVNLPPTSRRRR
jgi:spermidine synthase